jgi:hypothetical protein
MQAHSSFFPSGTCGSLKSIAALFSRTNPKIGSHLSFPELQYFDYGGLGTKANFELRIVNGAGADPSESHIPRAYACVSHSPLDFPSVTPTPNQLTHLRTHKLIPQNNPTSIILRSD